LHLRYSDQIQPLYDAQLFRQFNPDDLFRKDSQTGKAFEKELLDTLDSDEFKQKLPKQQIFSEELYPEKVSITLADELIARNLVAQQQKDGYFCFEKNTARVYMAILAKYLADLSDQLAIPSTDLPDYEELNFQAKTQSNEAIPSLRVEFRNLLRVPADDVELARIIDFRLKHNDKLLNFRQQVLDKFEDEIKKSTEVREIKDKTIRFRAQVERGIRELDQVMGESRFQTVMGTIKAIFKPPYLTLAAAGLGAATGAMTGSAAIAAIAGIGGVAGGTAAIEVTDYFVSRTNAKREKLRKDAYSYLYLAGKEFGTT
jgi:hypothetical protein